MYTLKLNDNQMLALLSVIKSDFEYAFNNGEDSIVESMEQDIDLLKSISYSFNNEDAKLRLQTIIAGYERDLRSVS